MFRQGSYANVASTLALIVALGGTSYAAVAIPKNSVGSKEIANSSITSKDVKNGALKSVDFKTGQLPAGPQGPAGPAGPAGPIGPSNAYTVDSGTNILNWTGDDQVVATLNVPAGNYVVHAKAMANNNVGASPAVVDCELRLGGTALDTSYDIFRVDVDSAMDRDYLPMQGAGTTAVATAITLVCDSNQTSGNWMDRAITAVKVGAVG